MQDKAQMECFNRLFSPYCIDKLHVKNRIFMATMGTNSGKEDDTVSERSVPYYAERAKGGVGGSGVTPSLFI
jgi:2,4-dienoyl-CoA reductase-like NADH-dependent reductase (Old Yellow Enzyme family)